MKKQNKNVSDSTILRRKAENLLNNKPLKAGTQMNEPEIPRLLHELQVHQVELEMQNEELRNAKDKVEITSRRYTELYDLAPTGYFTLLDNGEIVEINLSGAKLIGKNRSALINSNFKLFLSTTSLPVFNLFLQKIIDLKTKQTCEVVLSPFENRSVYVYLSGIPDNKVDQYFITAVDISEKSGLRKH
ncbi:MAG: PAS domain-containing protein [Draconibacterium sp.]|nr:PAS domain-containing protein [Draconibacterium sp.]